MSRITFIILLCVALSSALRGVRKTRSLTKRAAGGGCMYEGKVYQQGQTWTKQCSVNCVCQDGSTGLYKCTDICPTYGQLPKQCQMVQQPNSCCKKPECSFQAGTDGGSGQGGTVIGGGDGMGTMVGGTTCANKIDNCQNYGQAVCSNTQYTNWVIENCAAYCNKCGMTGTMTGGTMTGGTGTMTGGTGTMTGGTGTMTGGTGTMTGGTGTMTGGTGTMTGGTYTGTCVDSLANCAAYGATVCTDQQYTQWVLKNCQKTCNKCGSGGTMTGTMTGGTGTMTGGTGTMTGGTGTGTGTMTGGTGTMTGGTGTMTGPCVDKLTNCKAYGQTSCTDAKYDAWAKENCALTCNKCGSTSTGTGTGTGGTYVMPGGSTGTGTGTGTGGTYLVPGGTGTGTGTGTMTGTGGGTYLVPGGTGTGGTGTMTGGTGGMTGGTGGMTGTYTGSCVNALSNCDAYGKSVCSDPKYTAWAQKNCPAFCGLCSSGTGTMTNTGGGSSVYTGTGSGQATSGQSSGCVYKGQVYQQGQSWKDGCSFRCSCDDGSQGRYTCKQLCVNWSLPNACSLNEPAPGKCCKTPNCPPSVQLTYPPNYVAE